MERGLNGVYISKYERNTGIVPLIDGHTEVWGSFYDLKLGWGYKCCHSLDKDDLKCMGSKGKA